MSARERLRKEAPRTEKFLCHPQETLFESGGMNTKQEPRSDMRAPETAPKRRRLRIRPPANDTFSALTYVLAAALLLCEFIALFWLDIF